MNPNLFIVGAPKCGTTAWYTYLKDHPDIFFPTIKEPHYFAFDMPGLRETTSLAAYLDIFESASAKKVIGEASVFYMYSEFAAEAIAKFNKDAKIMIFLRDQEFFVPSFHQQVLFTFDEEMESFQQAWRLSGDRPANTIPPNCRDLKVLDYKRLGHIADQIARYSAYFSEEQIAVIRFDDWVNDPRTMYLKILKFLGVDDDGRDNFAAINQARYHKNRVVGRLLHHPPMWIEGPKAFLKKALNVDSLGVASKVHTFNLARGYTEKPDRELTEMIIHYYRDQRQRIDQLPVRFL